jgi:hypothetical protein
VPLACIGVVWWGLSSLSDAFSWRKHPTDQALALHFKSHQTEFEKLRHMLLADKRLEYVDYNSTRPENPQSIGVTQDRLREYRALLKRLELSHGIQKYERPDEIGFTASFLDYFVTSSAKGYIYSTQQPSSLKQNLDTYQSGDESPFTVYKHLEGHWYLYLDYEN